MTKGNIFLGDRVVLSLQDLKEYLGSRIPEQMLEAGGRGEIDLLFEVPIGCQLVLLPNRYQFDYKEGYFGELSPGSNPEYLVLLPELCKQLTRASSVNLRDATSGYRKIYDTLTGEVTGLYAYPPKIAAENPMRPVQINSMSGTPPSELPPGMQWENWAFKPHHSSEWHRIHREDLFVITSAFLSWMGWDCESEVRPDFFEVFYKSSIAKPDKALKDRFKSRQLLLMCEAAVTFWGDAEVIPDEPDSHPRNQVVIDWLMADKNAGFTKTSAECAASLIKPEFGLRAGAPGKRK